MDEITNQDVDSASRNVIGKHAVSLQRVPATLERRAFLTKSVQCAVGIYGLLLSESKAEGAQWGGPWRRHWHNKSPTLPTRLNDRTLRPGEAGYDAARMMWNGSIDHHPSLIIRAADVRDVIDGVNFARDTGLPLAVRGGGHHPHGFCAPDGGVVLDLSAMKTITVHPAASTVHVAGGATTGEFFDAVYEKGLIVTIGSHATVGMAGLTLGGGIGALMGKYGLVCDNLLAADLVTADGKLLQANATKNVDLFWALRGGGGNFGVVTALTYRLHPVEPVLAGILIHPPNRVKEMLRFYRDFMASAPNELTIYAILKPSAQGRPFCGLFVCYSGPLEAGERLLAPARKFGPPIMDRVQATPYTSIMNGSRGTQPAGNHYAWTTRGLADLSDSAIDAIVELAAQKPVSDIDIVVYPLHGAVSAIPVEATAFAERKTPYLLGISAGWPSGEDKPHLEAMAAFRALIDPFSTGTGYLNLMSDATETQVQKAYGPNYARLTAIKRRWDPHNLFRSNYNIPPRVS